jgi:hypothetical protein
MSKYLVIYLPAIVGVLYFITGVAYACRKEWAWAIVWMAYAVANVGLILAGKH